MIACLLVIAFFATIASGPAGLEWRDKRRARRQAKRDQMIARVIYLPSAACRGAGPDDGYDR